MKNLYVLLFILFLVSIVFISCSDSLESNVELIPYMSLRIGDERQFVSITDSSTILTRINGSAKRSDGFPVFSYAYYDGTDTTPVISYYGIKDGFLISTALDTVKDSSISIHINPFREQRLAKLFPQNGDTWQSIAGISSSPYFIASDIGIQKTFAGTFNNCFSYRFGGFFNVIYSKGIGNVASIHVSGGFGVLASYIKVNDKIYGSKMPPKDPINPDAAKNKNIRDVLSILMGIQ